MTHSMEFTDSETFLNFLDSKSRDLFEKVNKIDDLYWEIEKEGISKELTASLDGLMNLIELDLKNLFTAENLIYSELKHVMPEQSSVNAFKAENESILKLIDTLKSIVNDTGNLKKNKELLQAEIVTISDIIFRNLNKKESIMFHEARTLLSEKNFKDILEKYSSRPVYK